MILYVIGFIAIVIGIAINYKINKNRFNRRTASGLQQFSSYEKSWLTNLGEGSVKIIARLLIWGGVVFLIMGYIATNTHPHI